MLTRRRLFELLSVFIGSRLLGGCESPPTEKQVHVQVPNKMTIFEALHKTGHYPAFEDRELNGQFGTFIVGVDGQYEEPKNNKFWLFWQNDRFVNLPLDKVYVQSGDTIHAVLTTPEKLHA